MPDPQKSTFPDKQPYEGTVVARDDPKNLHRVKVQIPGPWEVSSPWISPSGAGYGGAALKGNFESPPLGAIVQVVFIAGNRENPRYITGDHPEGGIPLDDNGQPLAQLTNDGDNKVFQDERVRIERDARVGTYGFRVTDIQNNLLVLDLDLYGGQVGIETPLGILLKTKGAFRVEAGTLTLNGRPVLKKGKAI